MHLTTAAPTHDNAEIVQVAGGALTLRREVHHDRIRPRQESVLGTGPLPETADADYIAECVDAVAFAAAAPEYAEILDNPTGTRAPADRVTGPCWTRAQALTPPPHVESSRTNRLVSD
jgi:hypothetical protein